MAFVIKGQKSEPHIEFSVSIEDGDFTVKANGVDLLFIENGNGKLYTFTINEDDRNKIPGLSLTNGRLTVA